MEESKRGPSYVRSTVCLIDFSVASGGVDEVKRHIESKKHKDLATEGSIGSQ